MFLQPASNRFSGFIDFPFEKAPFARLPLARLRWRNKKLPRCVYFMLMNVYEKAMKK
jgi:hypothetical protein